MEFKISATLFGLLAAYLSFLALGAPEIPPEDERTIAELKKLGDDWDLVCMDDWRGENSGLSCLDENGNRTLCGDPDGIAKALDERDALRAMLVMDEQTRGTLWRRWWNRETSWLVTEPWLCLNY